MYRYSKTLIAISVATLAGTLTACAPTKPTVTANAAEILCPNITLSDAPVRVTETSDSFILDNGIIAIAVSKESGDLVSLSYRDYETLYEGGGHPYVYWSHDTRGGEKIETRISIDPGNNHGELAEVSIKGISGGRRMGHGPGTPPEGDLPIDIDIRYALARGDSAVYTYSAFEHRPEYGGGQMAEARIAAKLHPDFSHIHIDEQRNGKYPLFDEGIDKYVYVARQWDHRAYGWSDPGRGIGWFMLIPSPEFLSGGPTKAEFLAHGTKPTTLSYWKSSHNGGANVTLVEGEHWQRIVGPLLLYVNQGKSPDAMWNDAKARLACEESRWPYDWVDAPGYANADERGQVKGKLTLDDTKAPPQTGFSGWIHVGLSQTPYEIEEPTGPRTISWQNEAKHYQFWVRVSDTKNDSSEFVIPSVPAGRYNLTALADGVLGEFSITDIDVKAGETIDLGTLRWTPKRYGRQLWEIGTPDYNSLEFAGSDQFFIPGQPLRFSAQFPDSVEFIPGMSDPKTDWFYSHMPYGDSPEAEIRPFRGVAGEGRDAARTILFNLSERPTGKAVLRIAINGTGSRPLLDFEVNGVKQPPISFGRDDGSMKRHQINGIWKLVDTEFDASLLKQGDNRITLTVPEGALTNGVIYDYLRLELAD